MAMNARQDDDGLYVPDWARTLGAQGYRTFLRLIEHYFASKHIKVAIDGDEGIIKPSLDAIPYSSTLGLQNLAQICQRADRDAWHDLISAHFDSIFEAEGDDNALTVAMDDFASIRGRLRARIYPVDVVNHATEVVHRSGPEGTLEVLAIDLPTSVRTVSESEIKTWGVDASDLFLIGRRNLRSMGSLSSNVIQLEKGIVVTVYTGDAFYTASHVLLLDDYLPQECPHGVLVAVPKRDVMMIHPVRSVGAMEAAVGMLQVVIAMHHDGPGSISPFLYWYIDSEFITLPYELESKSLRFLPPDEFADLMDELGEVASYS